MALSIEPSAFADHHVPPNVLSTVVKAAPRSPQPGLPRRQLPAMYGLLTFFAMSVICGLSTIATLIAPPPFVAGDPPDDELLEPPPQPITTTATTAHNSATDTRRRVPRMGISPPALDAESQLLPHTNATYNV